MKVTQQLQNEIYATINNCLDGQIVCFPQINLTNDQYLSICYRMFGFEDSQTLDSMPNYLKNKLHGRILLSNSIHTSREDQPDFQLLFDLGLKVMATMKDDQLTQLLKGITYK